MSGSQTLGYFQSVGSTVSGAFSNVSSLGDAVNAFGTVASLFGGGAAVTLGSMSFSGWEVPDDMSTGGAQTHTIHKRIGGGRLIVVAGPDEDAIKFKARFLGSNAMQRMASLDTIRKSGVAQKLTVNSLTFNVLVSKCAFKVRRPNHVEYDITVEFLNPPAATAAKQTLVGSVLGDIKSATGIDVAGTLGTVQTAMGQAAPLLNGLSAISPALGTKLGGILGQASTLSGGLLSAANGNMAGLGVAASAVIGSSQALNIITGLSTIAPTIATASATGAFVSRAATSVASASGTSPTVSQTADVTANAAQPVGSSTVTVTRPV